MSIALGSGLFGPSPSSRGRNVTDYPSDRSPEPCDPAQMTLGERADELVRCAKRHMHSAVPGYVWRDEVDGYVCEQIAHGKNARLPKSCPKADKELEVELKQTSVHWGDDQRIHSELIRWLCATPAAGAFVQHGGVRITGAHIVGRIDLGFAEVPFPLELNRCNIEESVRLQYSRVRRIDFSGTHCRNIEAGGIEVNGDVLLRYGFRASRGVDLLGATINGDLVCAGGEFVGVASDDGGPRSVKALIADRLVVRGSVFLTHRFFASGEVRLVGARIGGNLECQAGTFSSFDADAQIAEHALNGDGLEVRGDVFLRDQFSARGEVRFLGAKIHGDLDCSGGTFRNPQATPAIHEPRAIDCERATIGCSFLAEDPCKFQGYVGLSHITIGAVLQLVSKGLFDDLSTLDVRNARVGVFEDDAAAWPAVGRLRAEGFRYDALHDNSPRSAAERLEWLTRLSDDRFQPQPYTQLANVLRTRGDRSGAKDVLVAREWRALAFVPRWYIRRSWGWTRGILLGFGYKPYRAIFPIVLLWLWSGTVFLIASRAHLMVPTARDATAERITEVKPTPVATLSIPRLIAAPETSATASVANARPIVAQELRCGYPDFWPFVYSIDAMTPLLDLQQDRYYIPRSDNALGSIVLWWLWVHIVLGWILFTLFLAAVTGLVTPGDG